jgi:hypothetical protein
MRKDMGANGHRMQTAQHSTGATVSGRKHFFLLHCCLPLLVVRPFSWIKAGYGTRPYHHQKLLQQPSHL